MRREGVGVKGGKGRGDNPEQVRDITEQILCGLLSLDRTKSTTFGVVLFMWAAELLRSL